jgi:hypothetical protein
VDACRISPTAEIEIDDGVRKIAALHAVNRLGRSALNNRDGRTEEVYSGDVVSWE